MPALAEPQLKAMTRRELLAYAQKYGIGGINKYTLKGVMIETILSAMERRLD